MVRPVWLSGLAESIKRSGGNVRLNSPVLRLSYDEAGRASGVDLLSGERVFAKEGDRQQPDGRGTLTANWSASTARLPKSRNT